MPYQRGSEEAYRGQPNFTGAQPTYNSDTLAMMRAQQARQLEQVGQIGNLNAQAIREPAEALSKNLHELPGAVMKGAEFQQGREKHQQGSEEHEAYMGNAAQTRDINAQNLSKQKAEMEDAQRRRDYLSGKGRSVAAAGRPGGMASEETYLTPEQQMWTNEITQGKLANDQARAGITASNMAAQQIKSQRERQELEDQASLDAFYQSKQQPAPRVGTPEGRRALSEAMAAGKIKQSASADNLVYSQSPSGAPVVEKLTKDIGPKVRALRELAEAKAAFDNTSDIPGVDGQNKDVALKNANRALQILGQPPVDWWGGDTAMTARGEQINAALSRAMSDLQTKIEDVKATKGAGSQEINSLIAQHEQVLRDLSPEGLADKKSLEELKRISKPGAGGPPPVGGVMPAGGAPRTKPSMFEKRLPFTGGGR